MCLNPHTNSCILGAEEEIITINTRDRKDCTLYVGALKSETGLKNRRLSCFELRRSCPSGSEDV